MEKMEKTLKALFDIQRFDKKSRLDAMIAEVEARYGIGGGGALLDDDALDIFAAGDPGSLRGTEKKDE